MCYDISKPTPKPEPIPVPPLPKPIYPEPEPLPPIPNPELSDCLAGNYINLKGECIECKDGTYTPSYGKRYCIPAKPGYYVDNNDKTKQIKCPIGKTSKLGSNMCYDNDIISVNNCNGICKYKDKNNECKRCTLGNYTIDNINCIKNNMISEIIFNTPGKHIFKVPKGIKEISIVCIGSGGSGGIGYNPNLDKNKLYSKYFNNNNSEYTNYVKTGGGSGGSVVWINNLSVSENTNINIVVGGKTKNANYNEYGNNGDDTIIYLNNILLIRAGGGKGGEIVRDKKNNKYLELQRAKGGKESSFEIKNKDNKIKYEKALGYRGGLGGESIKYLASSGGSSAKYTRNGNNGNELVDFGELIDVNGITKMLNNNYTTKENYPNHNGISLYGNYNNLNNYGGGGCGIVSEYSDINVLRKNSGQSGAVRIIWGCGKQFPDKFISYN